MSFTERHRHFAFVGSLIAAVVCSVGLVSSVGRALPAGTPPSGVVVLAPTTGASDVTFGLSFPSAQFCPGDAIAGYLWGTFLTSATNDPATLTFSTSGSPVGPSGFSATLRDPFGTPIRNQNPGLTDGIISPPGQLSFSGASFASVPAGEYWIGIACTLADADGVNQNVRYWAAPITIEAVTGAGPNNFTFAPGADSTTSTTTTTSSVPDGGSTTTSTTVAGGSTTTTVAGATTSTTVSGNTPTTVAGGSTSATVTPSSPTPGGSYSVTFPNCSIGETITFRQPESTPSSVTDVCEAASALSAGSVAGLRMPAQATTGTATASFTAAPTAPGSYTITMTGTESLQRTVTFVIVGPATPITGGNPSANTGGSPTSSSTGTIPSTGSSTTSLVVWGVLLLVFGRMALLLGRKPKVLTGT